MRFHCIADEQTVRGFRLAGITGQAVTSCVDAAVALQEALARDDLGIVILTDTVAAGIRPQLDAVRLKRDRPLLVEIPGPDGPMPGRKSLRQLVQEAVGMRIGPEEAS